MTAQNRIILTTGQIAAWREEDANLELNRADDERLEREINERNQRRKELRRKLEAAAVFSDVIEEEVIKAAPRASNGHGGSDEQADSAAFDLVANLQKTGDSLKVQQARQRLIDLGHEEKANRKNYVYGLLYRLVKSGKLVKRGSKYRAAPISSPEGETGAVGAPVSH